MVTVVIMIGALALSCRSRYVNDIAMITSEESHITVALQRHHRDNYLAHAVFLGQCHNGGLKTATQNE